MVIRPRLTYETEHDQDDHQVAEDVHVLLLESIFDEEDDASKRHERQPGD